MDEIEVTSGERVAEAIAGFGRTEDLRLSPDGRRVAIARFEAHAVSIVDVEIPADGDPQVAHTAVVTLVAPELVQPHGVDWLDERTLVVADRDGRVGLLAVPDARPGEATEHEVALLPLDGEVGGLYGPGSVRVVDRSGAAVEVLVCNNWGNRLTRHRFTPGAPGGGWTVADVGPGARLHLDLPDGLALSPDGAWLAVSNHNRQGVVLYEAAGDGAGDGGRPPVGVLRGTCYPHGLRFTPDGEHLLVADAGSRSVRCYRRGEAGWTVAAYPVVDIPVLTAEEHARGNVRPDEGGPKGVDVDPTGRLLAITAGAAPLRWFDLRRATAAPAPPPDAELAAYEVGALARETDLKEALARAELRVMETEVREHDAQALASRTADRADAAERRVEALEADLEAAWRRIEEAERCADEAREHLEAIQATRLWRTVAPLRHAYARLRARAAR